SSPAVGVITLTTSATAQNRRVTSDRCSAVTRPLSPITAHRAKWAARRRPCHCGPIGYYPSPYFFKNAAQWSSFPFDVECEMETTGPLISPGNQVTAGSKANSRPELTSITEIHRLFQGAFAPHGIPNWRTNPRPADGPRLTAPMILRRRQPE